MCSYPVVGAIPYASAKVEFEWEIPNFFTTSEFTNDNWDSPSFYFLNAEWCLRINLKVDGESHWWKGLYLVVRNPSSRYSVTFTLSIRRLEVPCKFGPENFIFDKSNTSCGSRILFHSAWLQRMDESDKSLVVYCDAAENLSSKACQTTFLNSTNILCRDLQDLLLSGRKSDVTIAVRDQEFKVHKVILEARSPVFAAMFERDVSGNEENVVKVEDCDPDTFQNFLLGVYAGSVDNLTLDKAIRLYVVAHKYNVTDIMGKCAQIMEEEMCEDTVCDILALANKYNATALKKSAETFMAENMNKIFYTSNWTTLIAENSLLQKYS